jgi:cell division protein FtsB
LNDLTEELSSPRETIWPKLNLLFGAMIVVVVGITLLYQTTSVVGENGEKVGQDKHIKALQGAIDAADLTNKRLAREVTALQRDPEYAGMIARDRLDLMKEGETILRPEVKK